MVSEFDEIRGKMKALLDALRAMKDKAQGADARALAVTITELEKAYAYFCTFCAPPPF